MSSELPEIDNPNCYVVDHGEAVGPLVLREIVSSIAAGTRRQDVFVWWSGASEWVRFNAEPGLLKLLDGLGEQVESGPNTAEIDLRATTGESGQDDLDLREITVVDHAGAAPLHVLGERLEALASATRESSASSMLDRVSAPPVTHGESSRSRSPNGSTTFDSLVRETISYERLHQQSFRAIELLASGCERAFTGRSFTLEGLAVQRGSQTSGRHELVFVSDDGSSQALIMLAPADSVASSNVQHVAVKVRWAERPGSIDDAFTAAGSDVSEPGQFGVMYSGVDIDDGLAFTSVDLVWPVERFVTSNVEIDQGALNASLEAIERALSQRWNELFGLAQRQ